MLLSVSSNPIYEMEPEIQKLADEFANKIDETREGAGEYLLATCPNPPRPRRHPSSWSVFRVTRASLPPLAFSIPPSFILANPPRSHNRGRERGRGRLGAVGHLLKTGHLERIFFAGRKGVTMKYSSATGSGDVSAYGNWGLLMDQMTRASVGTDPWTVIQNKLHPAVAETEFAPLDWSHLSRQNQSPKRS
jgi:hypothetical protein